MPDGACDKENIRDILSQANAQTGETVPCRACALVRRLTGAALVMAMAAFCLAASVWPDLVRAHAPTWSGMGLNTSLALALSGLALLWPRVRALLGGFVAAVGATVILQYLLPWTPADGPWRLAVNVDTAGAAWGGDMAPLTAFSLLCAGLTLTRLEHARGLAEQILLQVAPGLVLAAAAGGILNYSLDGLLFVATLDRHAVMRPTTTIALCLFVVGYFAALVETAWFRRFYAARAERQVLAISLGGLVAALLLGGAASIALLGRQMRETVEQELAQSVQNQAAILPLTVATTLHSVHARAAGLPDRADAAAVLHEMAGATGAAWLEHADGSVHGYTGRAPAVSRLRLPLRGAGAAWLTWNRGWMLEVRLPAPRGPGSLVVQEPLLRFQRFLTADAEGRMTGAETYVCGRVDEEHVTCLPVGAVPAPFRARVDGADASISMQHTLEGRHGVAIVPDPQGVMMVAAYAPVAEFGLGMVRELGAERIYRPVRSAMWRAIAVIALIGAIAVLSIYLRVRSVVRLAIETGRRLQGVLDALPVGVWIADAAGRVVRDNHAARRIWGGLRRSDAGPCGEGRGWWHGTATRVAPHDWPLARAVAHGESSEDELVDIECADGSRRTISASASPFYDEHRVLAGAVALCKDITKQVRADAEVRRLEREFHGLAENLPDIVSRFDRDLRRIYVNPAIERAMGVSREFLLGKTHAELGIPEGTVEIWMNALRRVFASGEPDVFEFSAILENGVVRHYHTRAVPERDATGAIQSVLTIAHDITALKGAEAVLRENEERLNRITSNVPGMVFQCFRRAGDDTLHFSYLSSGAKWLLGQEAADILRDGHALSDFVVADEVPAFHDSLRQSQATLSLWNWEGRIAARDGTEKWINLRATPRCNGDNACTWDGVAINITDSKISEEKLRNSQNLLRELSAHLESVREEERKRIAREIHDELGQTLTALRMDVSLARLELGEADPKRMARLQSMTDLVDRTIRTVRHVTSSLRPGALDLGIVAALEWLVEEFIGHAGIPCELVLGDGDINLDELTSTVIFRIVQESLTNIARHAAASQVEIIVTRSSGELCFEVRDNGRGFDPDAGANTKSFGLVGMRERVAMLNGRFELDSASGRGTCIRVCVPVA